MAFKIRYWFCKILAILPFFAQATSYYPVTVGELVHRSAATVIGKVISNEPVKNNNDEICRYIAKYKVHYSFSSGVSQGEVITVNSYDGKSVGDNYLLFLTKYEEMKRDYTSIPSIELKNQARCKSTELPDYLVMMGWLGEVFIDIKDNGRIEDGFINFPSDWLKTPKILIQNVRGIVWNEITEVTVSDFINYYQNDYVYVPWKSSSGKLVLTEKNENGYKSSIISKVPAFISLLSPDKTKIAYLPEPNELWLIDINTYENKLLYKTEFELSNIQFSLDDKYIYYTELYGVNSDTIFRYNLITNSVEKFYTANTSSILGYSTYIDRSANNEIVSIYDIRSCPEGLSVLRECLFKIIYNKDKQLLRFGEKLPCTEMQFSIPLDVILYNEEFNKFNHSTSEEICVEHPGSTGDIFKLKNKIQVEREDLLLYFPSDLKSRLKQRAESGNSYAAYLLGSLYYFGDGWISDETLSRKYLELYLSITQDNSGNDTYTNIVKNILAGNVEKYSLTDEQVIFSPNKKKFVWHSESSVLIEECYENCSLNPLNYITIVTGDYSLHIFSHAISFQHYDWIEDIQFYDDEWLLVYVTSTTSEATYLINTETLDVNEKHLPGKPSIISFGVNKGLIKISGIKSYFQEGGAYWYNAIYDIEGNLLELVPSPPCTDKYSYPETIKRVININNHQKIKQKPSEKVCISR